MKTKGSVFCLFLVMVVCSLGAAIPQKDISRNDGNYWKRFDEESKVFFVNGFMHGMLLGRDFAAAYTKGDKNNCDIQARVNYASQIDELMTNVTVGQIVAGLDDFYTDYRNRLVLIYDGVHIVLMEIAGVPKFQIDMFKDAARRKK